MTLGVSFFSFGQLNRADRHFEEEEFSAAIIYYHKVLKKDASNKGATQNLAFSYRKLKDYVNAEIYYARATTLDPGESSNFLYYGQALKNNNKLKEAKNQFEKFASKNPTSFIGRLMVQSYGDIKSWEVEEKEFEVTAIENINTKNADFCPLVYEGGIVFVSERGVDLVNTNHLSVANKPYLSLYYARKDKGFKKAKSFSNQLSSLYHDGPVSISDNGDEIYFTRADNRQHGKGYINRLQIFSAKLDGKKWKNIIPFKYNSQDYSVAHPFLSLDGNQLFFASDMEGGNGGMDIYVCKKEGEIWSKPINLGQGVNTEENEVFPYFRKGALYFSSEGHSGYGGLDVFMAKELEQWRIAVNLKAPLNSSKDDFGMFYTDDTNGYFSSNRDGGEGSDDIYGFSWNAIVAKTQITGILEYDKLGASGSIIKLLDEEDQIVGSAVADKFGKFKFDKLDIAKNYSLAIDSFLDDANLYLTNSKGEKVMLVRKTEKGKFKCQALPYKHYDELTLLNETDDAILTSVIFGQLYNKLPGGYSGVKEIWAVDDEGNIISKTTSDAKGFFSFEKLPSENEILFMLAEDDESININIGDETGKYLATAKILTDGKYKYSRLESDDASLSLIDGGDESIAFVSNETVSTVNVFGQLYNKLPGGYSGVKEIWAVDDEGNIISKTTSDAKGFFSFEKLPSENEILFMLAEEDQSININIGDETGKYLATAKILIDGKFRFSRLAANRNILALLSEVDESEMDLKEQDIFIFSEVKFEYQSFKVVKSGEKELDKLIAILNNNKDVRIEISGHTDSRGRTEYNQQLGRKRADAVLRYVVLKGIYKDRIRAKSYGETRPVALNNLPDGTDNPEGRARNRRVEFKVIKLR